MYRTVKCGAVEVYSPLPTFCVALGALGMIYAGLFEKQGEPDGYLVIIGFFLIFSLFGFQIWATSNLHARVEDSGGRAAAHGGGSVYTVPVQSSVAAAAA